MLRFGTGAGITWGSDPDAEWAETELKAARLVGLTGTTASRAHERAWAHAACWAAAAAASGGRGTPSSPMTSGVHVAPVTTEGPAPVRARARTGSTVRVRTPLTVSMAARVLSQTKLPSP